MKITNEYLYPLRKQNGPDYFWQLTKIIELFDGSWYKQLSNNQFERIDKKRVEIIKVFNWSKYNTEIYQRKKK